MADLNLVALVEEGLSGTEILARMRSTMATANMADDVWRRLALPIRFDAALYSAATKDVAHAPGFDAISTSPDIQRVDAPAGMVAVVPPRRKALFELDPSDLDELRPLASGMLRELESRGAAFELDALAVSLVVDAKAAASRFKALYGAADATFDIPRCSQLLEILRARIPLAPDLLELLYEYGDYFRARTMFVEDFYRSASYLDRPSLRRDFDTFWKSDKWLLRLYGKGGRGKTMFLRWLIARRCLPRNDRVEQIAVARVDFDELSLTAFDHHPWLVMLPIMRQLSPQLPNRPFQTLIRDLDEYASYLRTPERTPDVDAALQARKAFAIEQFRSGLGAHPVLLVFDTCEEPLIHRKTAFVQLLETFVEARTNECTQLRLLLSGRYDPKARGLSGFDQVSDAIEVTPFAAKEAKAYLTKHRRMKPGTLVNAIVAKSGGNPFNLGLFADLASSAEGLSLQDVRDAPQAEFIYLLDRVILRIPQESVRWLVRYAAITKELTFEFASEVIAPLLRRNSGDKANEFAAEALAKRYATRQPWPAANLTNMEQVWEDLRAYASNPSWIIWDDKAKSLKLQAEVVGPMRQLLREHQPFYDAVHKKAEAYWRRAGRAKRTTWAVAVAAEFFHKFHRLGPAAGQEWRKVLDDPRLADTSDRLRVAEAVLDLLGEREGFWTPESQAQLVDEPTVLRARAEVALAALAARLKVGRTTEDERWKHTTTLADQWNAISEAPAALVRQVVTTGELQLLRAAYRWFRQGQLPPLTPLRKLALPPRLRLLARMLAGRLSYERAFIGRRSDTRDFDVALTLSAKLHSKDFPTHQIWFLAGMLHLRQGDLSRSNEAFKKAWRLTPKGGVWPPGAIECFWRLVQGLRTVGRWAEAMRLVESIPSSDRLDQDRILFQQWHARAAIALDLGDVIAARRALDEAKVLGDASVEPAWQELDAEVALRSYNVSAANKAIRAARGLYPKGGLGRQRMDNLEAASLVVSGALKVARARMGQRIPYYWSLRLEDAEARARAGARLLLRMVKGQEKDRARATRTRAVWAAYGRMRNPAQFLKDLAALDTPARFAALVPFEETDRTQELTGARLNAALDRALPAAPANTSDVSLLQRVALASALRFFGRSQRALDILRNTTPSAQPTVEWRRLRALAAVGVFDSGVEKTLDALHEQMDALPNFVAVASIEALEWALRYEKHAAAGIAKRASTMRVAAASIGPIWSARLALAESELRILQGHWDDAIALVRQAQTSAKSAGDASLAWRAATRLRGLRPRTTGQPASQKRPRRAPETQLVPVVDEWRFTRRSRNNVLFEARLASGAGFKHPHTVPGGLDDPLSPSADPVSVVHALSALDHRFREHLNTKARFRLGAGVLSALPWEVLAPNKTELFYRSGLEDAALDETTRWIHAALRKVGGKTLLTPDLDHPDFRKALAELRSDPLSSLHDAVQATVAKSATPGRAPSRVIIGEPSSEWQYGNRRGYAPRSTNLASAYSKYSVEHVTQVSEAQSPSVIHFAGVFNDTVRGSQAITLDPHPSRRADWPGEWSAHNIASLCASIPAERVKPLIILDALSTASAADATQEGLRRNTMCAELFADGAARAVLGFGLMKPGKERELLSMLLSGIELNVSVGRLHAGLMARRADFLFPPALWADDPYLPANIDL